MLIPWGEQQISEMEKTDSQESHQTDSQNRISKQILEILNSLVSPDIYCLLFQSNKTPILAQCIVAQDKYHLSPPSLLAMVLLECQ